MRIDGRFRGLRAPGLRTAVALCASLLAGACGDGGSTFRGGGFVAPPEPRPVLDAQYRPTNLGQGGHAFVHLFQWTWANVATECEQRLGPDGWKAVQVSPPQEHYVSSQWWVVYQPVSYKLDATRSGTRAQFVDMVQRCRAAGVDVYVDAVLNHMTAGSGTGSAGTSYTKYNYPGLWTANDFHTPCGITNYNSAQNVQDCELVGLADLNTGLASVRRKLADYCLSLLALGVRGFRIDAAKHIQPVQLDSIVTLVNREWTAAGNPQPYWFSEVIDYGGEAVRAFDYYGLGYASGGASDITEFRFRSNGEPFTGANGRRVSQLNGFSGLGLMPSDKAVVFLENHDTQRSDGISYRDGQRFRLANVWLLAQPYGYPSVLSGYAFDRNTGAGRDGGPPHDAMNPRAVTCAASFESAVNGEFTCEHRDPMIRRMVRFRRAVGNAPVNASWSDGADALAFSRGAIGFVLINNGTASLTATVPSGLSEGTYCEVLTGGRTGASCTGTSVSVAAGGTVNVTVPARSAIVLLSGDRL